MQAVIFAIHLIISAALVGVILLQRSEGGALGIGGGNNGLISGRGAASVLTRTTGILAGLFFVTSLTLAALAGIKKKSDGLDLDAPVTAPLSAPLSIPAAPVPAAPTAIEPAAPVIPAPSKSSALELAPKPSIAAAKPATAAKPTAPKPAPAAVKPAIPEPTAEAAPAPAPAGPTDSGAAEGPSGGAGGPQPR